MSNLTHQERLNLLNDLGLSSMPELVGSAPIAAPLQASPQLRALEAYLNKWVRGHNDVLRKKDPA